MTEDKSSRYHRLRRRADLGGTALAGLVLVWLCASGASIWLREVAAAAAGRWPSAAPDVVTAALQTIFVVGVLQACGFPFALYQGFVLEHRYGLSTQSGAQWLADQVKGAVLGLGLAAAGATVVFATLRQWPDRWWVLSFTVFAVALIGVVRLAPVVLLPLFYRFRPLDRPTLVARLRALADAARTEIAGIYEWHLSSHTRKANAALAGLGRTRRILLSDTLLADYSDDEIEVVLAHELAHHVHRDLWRGLALQAGVLAGGFAVADLALRRFAGPLGLQGLADPAGLPLLMLAGGCWSLLTLPLVNGVSRAQERAADRYALTTTRNVSAFVSAMRRLAQQNLAEEHPPALARWLFHSHPPIRERIDAARTFAGHASGG